MGVIRLYVCFVVVLKWMNIYLKRIICQHFVITKTFPIFIIPKGRFTHPSIHLHICIELLDFVIFTTSLSHFTHYMTCPMDVTAVSKSQISTRIISHERTMPSKDNTRIKPKLETLVL